MDFNYNVKTLSKDDKCTIDKLKLFFIENDKLFFDPFSNHVIISDYMNKLVKYADILYIEEEKKILGMCCAYNNDNKEKQSHLMVMLVSSDNQRKNIGFLLGKEMLKIAKRKNMMSCVLTVDIGNVAAEQLYRKLRFVDFNEKNINPKKKNMIINF